MNKSIIIMILIIFLPLSYSQSTFIDDSPIMTYWGHSFGVNDFSFNSDGSMFVSASEDKTLLLWNTTSGEIVREFLGHNQPPFSVDWNEKYNVLVSTSSGGSEYTNKIWNFTSETEMRSIDETAVITAGGEWNFDNELLATVHNTEIKIWNTTELVTNLQSSVNPIFSFFPSLQRPEEITWNPKSNILAFTNSDNFIFMSNSTTGAIIHQLTGHTTQVKSLSWESEGKYLASGSLDNTIKVWDFETAKPIRILFGHTSGVTAVGWSFDGSIIATGDQTGIIKYWNFTTGEEIYSFKGHYGEITALNWLPENNSLMLSASLDGTLKMWNTSNFEGPIGPTTVYLNSTTITSTLTEAYTSISQTEITETVTDHTTDTTILTQTTSGFEIGLLVTGLIMLMILRNRKK